ncbi:MAG TPA: DUF4153 domain-containing protein [Eubacteriaceae bacterium]|nr:DUF4153 domain-containing protein [Eubacteriaceae bacterium]
MKWIEKVKSSAEGLIKAVSRYPLTTIFLIAGAVANAMAIESNSDASWTYQKLFVTFVVGALLAVVAQVVYERFFKKSSYRLFLGALAVVLDLGYYFIIRQAPQFGIEISVRTTAIVAALLVAFVWIPAMKTKMKLTQSFLGTFKAFFISLFFSGVLFLGITMILGAVDVLLVNIDEMLYAHASSLVFVLFAPIYLLSLIPNYNTADETIIRRTVDSTKFLEILISYIVIPLVSIFTVILVLYIALNIGGEFWTENLIEPMLVAYSIVVIVVLFLSANMDNKFAENFHKIFPKVLIPLVLFQILASTLKIGEEGLTHSRYYVIMYGAFALVAGAAFSFRKSPRVGIIAAVFIALSVVSIVPPVDAFTVSRQNQIGMLEEVLEKNNMLSDNEIVANENVPDEDKQKITDITAYIWRMDYMDEVAWFEEDFDYYNEFEETFGFARNEQTDRESEYAHFYRESTSGIRVSGYDFLSTMRYMRLDKGEEEMQQIDMDGTTYRWGFDPEGKTEDLTIEDENGKALMRYDFGQVIAFFEEKFEENRGENLLSEEEGIFTEENEQVAIKIVIQRQEIFPGGNNGQELNHSSEFVLMVDIKE